MKKHLGAVSGAMIDKSDVAVCIHDVIMASRCTLCFREFGADHIRRRKTHVEHDWNPLLQQLDPHDGPLTMLMRRVGGTD